jgi:hypothetical protein
MNAFRLTAATAALSLMVFSLAHAQNPANNADGQFVVIEEEENLVAEPASDSTTGTVDSADMSGQNMSDKAETPATSSMSSANSAPHSNDKKMQ